MIKEEMPICPFYQKKCIAEKCAAFILDSKDIRLYRKYGVYDKVKDARVRIESYSKKWSWSKLGYVDVKESRDEMESKYHLVKYATYGQATCSVLKIVFGVYVEERNVDEWKALGQLCFIPLMQYNARFHKTPKIER